MGRKREHSLVHLAPRDAVPMRHRTIVVGGYTVLDVVVTPGGRWNSAGGTAGNVAASMAHLGWTSSLVARIGRDAAGRAVQRRLLRVGVSTRALILIRMRPRRYSDTKFRLRGRDIDLVVMSAGAVELFIGHRIRMKLDVDYLEARLRFSFLIGLAALTSSWQKPTVRRAA